MQPVPPERLALGEASTVDLVREALDEAKELVRIEVQLAKGEVERELARAKRAAIGIGIAIAIGFIVLTLLAVAVVLAVGGTAVAALVVAACLAVLAAVAGAVGYALLPKKPMDQTRHRLESDVRQLKERIA
jgi:uncharacterized membrane protein YqjE